MQGILWKLVMFFCTVWVMRQSLWAQVWFSVMATWENRSIHACASCLSSMASQEHHLSDTHATTTTILDENRLNAKRASLHLKISGRKLRLSENFNSHCQQTVSTMGNTPTVSHRRSLLHSSMLTSGDRVKRDYTVSPSC